jgi:hypothetical protein
MLEKKIFIILLVLAVSCYYVILSSNDKYNHSITIKCLETTGTGRNDIFKINNPSFQWFYKGKWYEIGNSKNVLAKDWNVKFTKNNITLYNYKTKWYRYIDLDKMSALMKFPTGEEYIYKCNFIDK